jgi:hypothetical protein
MRMRINREVALNHFRHEELRDEGLREGKRFVISAMTNRFVTDRGNSIAKLTI